MMHNEDMILDGVDVFVRVVEASGFSAAARQLGMPVTTVSAKVARLEERLGVTLIQRSTRRMHVTSAGDAYYRHCREAIAALAAGEDELAAASATPSGPLRITAPSDIAQTMLPPIIEQFMRTYPLVSIDLIVTNTHLDLLGEGVDLALRASPQLKDSTLSSRKLGGAELGLFASAAYLDTHGVPRTPADLAAREVLVHSRFPLSIRISAPSGDSFLVEPSARVRADDMQTLRALAAHGVGIGLLPDMPAERGTLVRVLPEYGTHGGALHFVFPGGRFTPVNVRAFIDLAVAATEAVRG